MTSSSTDPLIGRLIDGRYQVRSRVARGGMATVYLATDLRLDRRVALKVMHGHLSDDAEYKARFIQEARSAARLAHPNVVNVYDQGQDGEIAYLVMEYLPGITLRELLAEHPVLTNDQTLDILEAVLAGLAAAHRNGIVHRDLKPENVLLADDGRIKISDFGLARATTTQTAAGSALLGTIAYLSPELVTRGVADARSDIYAVGIMLYEMLAGEQPYKGDQPLLIAQQHANDTVPTPSTLNPRVTVELDELVQWATARDPEQRPRDAKAMLDQVLDIRRLIAEASPETAPQHTLVLSPAVDPSSDAETQVLGQRVAAAPATGGASTIALARASERRRTRGVWAFVLVIVLAALAGGTGWYFGSGPGARVTIPDVQGLTPEAAIAELTTADLLVADETIEVHSLEVEAGRVIDTDPPVGTQVNHGDTVSLVVSLGAELLPVPELVGKNEQVARQAIVDARFTVDDARYQFSEADAGVVLTMSGEFDGELRELASGSLYPEAAPITLLVSLGPVPSVVGLSVEDATEKLAEKGLTGSVAQGLREYHDDIPRDHVTRLVLPEGPLTTGSTVELVVSDGIEQVAVPNVVGMSWTEARPILEAEGFRIAYADGISQALGEAFPSATIVRSTSPEAGETLDKGSKVTVRLRTGD